MLRLSEVVSLSEQSQPHPPYQLWDDIEALSPSARERLGYPTQKPLALLERIIKASSKPNDIVLDAFCGCAGCAPRA